MLGSVARPAAPRLVPVDKDPEWGCALCPIASGAVRVGIHLGFATATFPRARRAALLREAEQLGYDSLWSGESTGYDAVTPLAWVAAVTERIGIGSAVLQMPARSPATVAMTAAALDRCSDGRFRCGIGVSTPTVAADWHGAGHDAQIQRTREYLEVLRAALAGERVAVDGQHWRLPAPGSDRRPLRLTDRPVQERLPILLAALGPRSVRLCGELADGWMPNHSTPEFVRGGMAWLREGAGGELPAGHQVVLNLTCAIDEDVDRARDAVRPILAVYLGMGTPETSAYQRLMRRQGFAEPVAEVHALFAAGKIEEARAALPAELLDQVALCGDAARVGARLEEYSDAGVTTLVPFLMPSDPDGWGAQLRALAAVAAPWALTAD